MADIRERAHHVRCEGLAWMRVRSQRACCCGDQVGILSRVEFLEDKEQTGIRDAGSCEGQQNPSAHSRDGRGAALIVERMIFLQQRDQFGMPLRIGDACIDQRFEWL